MVHNNKRSAAARKRRKKAKIQKQLDGAHEKEGAELDEASKRIPTIHTAYEVTRVHTDADAQRKWGGELAYPPGLKSFVDDFRPESEASHVGVETSRPVAYTELVTVYDGESDLEMYSVEGESVQAGEEDPIALRGHLKHGKDLMASNMSTKRG